MRSWQACASGKTSSTGNGTIPSSQEIKRVTYFLTAPFQAGQPFQPRVRHLRPRQVEGLKILEAGQLPQPRVRHLGIPQVEVPKVLVACHPPQVRVAHLAEGQAEGAEALEGGQRPETVNGHVVGIGEVEGL